MDDLIQSAMENVLGMESSDLKDRNGDCDRMAANAIAMESRAVKEYKAYMRKHGLDPVTGRRHKLYPIKKAG